MKWSTLRSKVSALTRVAGLLAVLSALFITAGIKHSVATTERGLLELGRHLSVMAESGLGKNDRRISLNGQVMGFRVLTSDHETTTILDHYEAWCRHGSGAFSKQLDTLSERDATPLGDSSWRDMTLRSQDRHQGFVACIKGPSPRPPGKVIEHRLDALGRTGNLSELGRFHYAYVSERPDHRLVVAAWTEGEFYPGKLFPVRGDAPGFDVAGIPRPPSGRRTLSAGELGHGETLTVYVESEESMAALQFFYRRAFARNGWTLLADTPTGSRDHSFLVERRGDTRIVTLGTHAGQSWVAIACAN